MTTSDALLAAVLANPDDDMPRLALCDWWDEFGTDAEKVRSEFVRVQVELAKRGPYCHKPGLAKQVCILCIERYHLKRRQRELWPSVWPRPSDTNSINYVGTSEFALAFRDSVVGIVRRGFVAEVRCTISDWCGDECHQCAGTGRSFPIDGPSIPCRRCGGSLVTGIGPRVVRSHPVERVVVTDREPLLNGGGGVSWWGDHAYRRQTYSQCGLPAAVFDNLRGMLRVYEHQEKTFPTREAAIDALSAALIAWAKSQPRPARIVATPVSVDFVTG